MKITIDEASPDGLLVKAEEPFYADTMDEAFRIVEILYEIERRMKKQTQEEIKEFLREKFPIKEDCNEPKQTDESHRKGNHKTIRQEM